MLGLTKALEPALAGTQPDTTEENIQARARGIILMALSNKFGGMVVTTGNKSEMSVGYATLYGDMNGGYNPIKDLYKMEVYRLARWRNAHVPKGGKGPAGEVIPENIITKVPTAELRPNQTDQDSLPPYEALDDILASLVEKEMPLAEIVKRGHARRNGEEDRALALPRRVQAASGPARREDLVAEFRTRPPLSDREQVPRAPLRRGSVITNPSQRLWRIAAPMRPMLDRDADARRPF